VALPPLDRAAISPRFDPAVNASHRALVALALKPDILVTYATAMTLEARRATTTIPVVMVGAGDPVGTGLVASLARPGGNVTGLSMQQTDLAAKRLELLREVVPALRRLAILGNAGNPVTLRDMREVEVAAGTPGLTVATAKIWRVEDLAAGFESLC